MIKINIYNKSIFYVRNIMQLIGKSILFIVMICVSNPLRGSIFDHPENHWKQITAIAAITTGGVSLVIGYLLRGISNDAERLKHEHILRNEKVQKMFHEIKNKRKIEITYFDENKNELTKEMIERFALRMSYNQYVEEIQDDLKRLYPLCEELTPMQQKEKENIISMLKIIEERSYIYFKNEIIQERKQEEAQRKKQQLYNLILENEKARLAREQATTKVMLKDLDK